MWTEEVAKKNSWKSSRYFKIIAKCSHTLAIEPWSNCMFLKFFFFSKVSPPKNKHDNKNTWKVGWRGGGGIIFLPCLFCCARERTQSHLCGTPVPCHRAPVWVETLKCCQCEPRCSFPGWLYFCEVLWSTEHSGATGNSKEYVWKADEVIKLQTGLFVYLGWCSGVGKNNKKTLSLLPIIYLPNQWF